MKAILLAQGANIPMEVEGPPPPETIEGGIGGARIVARLVHVTDEGVAAYAFDPAATASTIS
jgi:hypothetical protein